MERAVRLELEWHDEADAEISRLQQKTVLLLAYWFRLFCADACATERMGEYMRFSC